MTKQGSGSVATNKRGEKRKGGKGVIRKRGKERVGKGRSYTSAIAIFTTLTG